MRITWTDLLRDMASVPDGADVEIEGFIAPLSSPDGDAPASDALRRGYFALVAEPSCCVGCLPADPAQRIEVFAAAAVAPSGRQVRLAGKLRRLRNDPAGWRFQLREARLVASPMRLGLPRRGMLAGSLMCLAAAGPDDAAAQLIRAQQALADRATVDAHSHAGSMNGQRRIREHAPFTPLAEPMRAGGLAVTCLAIVSDSPTHRVMPDGRLHPFRTPDPGELYAFAQLAFQRLHDLLDAQGLAIITDARALAAARSSTPSVVIAAEGGDFLEGRPERVDEAYERWQLRHLQLTHYRVNELGDIQTEEPVHGGLTDIGAEIVRRCNRRGLVVDVAHGTYDLVKRAASVTTKPLLLSHTSLSTRGRPFTRTITPDHARAVAGTGGVIGIWPPASIFSDLNAMAGGFARMIDVVGIDHVALGSDMQGLVGPSTFPSYEQLPELAAALLARGFGRDDVAKLLGGNYLRLFAASMA